MLSYDYWRTASAPTRGVIGKTITVNNYPLTIIGVSQAGFDGVDIGYVAERARAADDEGADDAELGRSSTTGAAGG